MTPREALYIYEAAVSKFLDMEPPSKEDYEQLDEAHKVLSNCIEDREELGHLMTLMKKLP